MLVEMIRRDCKPDLVLFADTGGERPEIYQTVQTVSTWLKERSGIEIVTVSTPGPTLEQDCLMRKALPSIAYGFRTCSDGGSSDHKKTT
jgi:hypothetical protein